MCIRDRYGIGNDDRVIFAKKRTVPEVRFSIDDVVMTINGVEAQPAKVKAFHREEVGTPDLEEFGEYMDEGWWTL